MSNVQSYRIGGIFVASALTAGVLFAIILAPAAQARWSAVLPQSITIKTPYFSVRGPVSQVSDTTAYTNVPGAKTFAGVPDDVKKLTHVIYFTISEQAFGSSGQTGFEISKPTSTPIVATHELAVNPTLVPNSLPLVLPPHFHLPWQRHRGKQLVSLANALMTRRPQSHQRPVIGMQSNTPIGLIQSIIQSPLSTTGLTLLRVAALSPRSHLLTEHTISARQDGTKGLVASRLSVGQLHVWPGSHL